MAQIKFLPFIRHVRSDPSRHLILFHNGSKRRSGRGIAFWYLPLSSSLVEIPCDDREVAFLFHARSEDYQDVTVQGSVTYRVEEPEQLATRVDFTIDPFRGHYNENPLERLEEFFAQLTQKIGSEYVAARAVRVAISEGQRDIRRLIEQEMGQSQALSAMGLVPVAVHVGAVTPSAELEKALQAPTRESIQQRSDEAVFERRALAVEKERAIRENELRNQIELARQEEELIGQEGQNEQRKVEEAAQAAGISVRAQTERERVQATARSDVTRVHAEGDASAERLRTAAEAEGLKAIESVRVDAEQRRMDIYRDLPPHVLLGLAAQEFAGKLQRIERIQLTPDGIGPLLNDLAEAGARLVNGKAAAALKKE